ncbi:DMT family transporter [Cystobacter ferrugineus]|uniref:QacE family quaternary ammonium compound efflux SMR transporter n=1 Tax=Cystobacter ferrugineus TaxID=83449 RepID=A0A1L9AYK4_9BACT|nr:multidrug efflux SMR transporter [Cystobacter ferrugineus]OJH35088.1 QacE family quaternary ammonium compound efflux SMR transporter [Cystobacter ferrugineus]
MNPYVLLSISILVEVLATSSLRASEGFTRVVPSVVVVVGYGTAFYLMSQALKSLPLGFTYAVWSGVGTALTAMIGWFYFRDAFHWSALVGIGLIIAGVVVLNVGGAVRH